MKLAIHHRPESFSEYWISWCEKENIDFKIVNAYDTDIISSLSDCDGLLWHWHHNNYADQLIAKHLTHSLEAAGKKVFPNTSTAWHFDNKVAQKYLLEAIDFPVINSFCFYTKKDAIEWVNTAKFPLVFKLKGGSGSRNVQLVKNKKEALALIKKAFGKGFPPSSLFAAAKQKLWEFKRDKEVRNLYTALYYFCGALINAKTKASLYRTNDIGYIYFQEFIPENSFDDRIIIIGERCFCVRRHCRDNDFRASGSGVAKYDHTIFPIESIKLAFSLAKKIKSQSLAMDIIYDHHNTPKIVEISYGFITGPFYEKCDGYWDSNLVWHDKKVTPQYFIIEDFVNSLSSAKDAKK